MKKGSLKSEPDVEIKPLKVVAPDGLYYTLFRLPNSGNLYTFVTVKIVANRVVSMTKTVEDLFSIKEAQLFAAIMDNPQ